MLTVSTGLPKQRAKWLGIVIELTLICYAAWCFTTPIHRIDETNSMPGREHQRLSGVILPVRTAWQDYREFAQWNPYLYIGEPLIANPFNYLWNPIASVPVLLLGGSRGTAVGSKLPPGQDRKASWE